MAKFPVNYFQYIAVLVCSDNEHRSYLIKYFCEMNANGIRDIIHYISPESGLLACPDILDFIEVHGIGIISRFLLPWFRP